MLSIFLQLLPTLQVFLWPSSLRRFQIELYLRKILARLLVFAHSKCQVTRSHQQTTQIFLQKLNVFERISSSQLLFIFTRCVDTCLTLGRQLRTSHLTRHHSCFDLRLTLLYLTKQVIDCLALMRHRRLTRLVWLSNLKTRVQKLLESHPRVDLSTF